MNTNLTVTGKQPFMDGEIPVVLGGFGPNAKCICDKTVAEIHGIKLFHVREIVARNNMRFRNGADYIDLKNVIAQRDDFTICSQLGYSRMEISRADHLYLFSERGYAKLVKIMDTDQAWDIYEHLLDEYFYLRDTAPDVKALSPELQIVKAMFDQMARTELKQKEQAKALDDVNQRVDGIRDVVALNPYAWRTECRNLLSQIAQSRGGGDAYREVHNEVFQLVDDRAGVSLATRLTNKRRRMADEGVCKSRRDRLTKVDVIADDKKLIEIYTAIVKEMAIANGVSPEPTDVDEDFLE